MSAFLRRLVAKRILGLLNKTNGELQLDAKRLQDIIKVREASDKRSNSQPQFRINPLSEFENRNNNHQELYESIRELQIPGEGDDEHLRLEPEVIAKEVIGFIRRCGSNYGYTDADGNVGKHGTIVVEFSSPNIAKPFHAGHLRSTVIGNYIANLYEKLGYKVIRLNYLGDWGTQFGLLSVGYQLFGDDAKLREDPMQHLFDVYVKTHNKAESEMKQNDSTTRDRGQEACRKLENGDEDQLALWKKFRELSIQEYIKTYARLGTEFTEYHSENMYIAKSYEVIEQLKKLGILKVDEDGKSYVEVDTVPDDSRRAVVLKSDGTTLYLLRDVAALLDRHDKYKFDKILYVCDESQHHHFRWLEGIVKQMVDWSHKFENMHVKFGRVIGMSTRKGKVVFLRDILDEAQRRVLEAMQTKKSTKITENMDAVADVLGASTLIVEDLSRSRTHSFTFDWDQALKVGKRGSGISFQYAHARLCNIEKYSGVTLEETFDPSCLTIPEAQALLLHLARYEDITQNPQNFLEPKCTVKYLQDLCYFMNLAYRKMRVKDEEPDKAQAYLQLFHVTRLTLANGMRVLGLKPLEEF